MKKIIVLLAATALFAVSCTEKPKADPSLSVTPAQITFAAENAAPQTVDVKAVETDWNVSVSENAKAWLTAEKTDDKTVTISITDNTSADQRIGSVIVTPDTDRLNPKEITVMQAGSETPAVYELELSTSTLEFEAENAEKQTVTVTATEGMGWTAAASADCANWVTVTAAESSFTVEVKNNFDAQERNGSIVVTADREDVKPKIVLLSQKNKPSITTDVSELVFFADGFPQFINVTAVGCEWTVKTEDEDGKSPVDWLQTSVSQDDKEIMWLIKVSAATYTETVDRHAYIVISSDNESVDDVRIPVTQKAAEDTDTDLEDDITMSIDNHYILFYPKENSDYPSQWDIRIWSDGITYSESSWPPYSGTGQIMQLYLYTEAILFDADQKYELPTGTYNIDTPEYGMEKPWTILSGTSELESSTYQYMKDGQYTSKIGIASGSLEVARDGEDYVLTIKFKDANGIEINGNYTGKLNINPAN